MNSFLNNFSFDKKVKGASIYNNNNVIDLKLEKNKINGHVEGSDQEVFTVSIDIINPSNSTCSCSKKGFCEHMVALFFEVYPDEYYAYRNDYDEYDDEDDDYYTCDFDDEFEYDEYVNEKQDREKFDVDHFIFNRLLNDYVDSLSLDELKELYKKCLLADKSKTFNAYLKDKYDELLENNSEEDEVFMEIIKNRVKLFENKNYDSYLFDEHKKIFDDNTLLLIEKVYSENRPIRNQMNLILLLQSINYPLIHR